MKFSDHLQTCMTPEWRKQYITYWTLKSMLYAGMRKRFTDEDPHNCERHLRSVQEVFFQTCSKELVKVNRFYSEKFSEAQGRLTMLRLAVGDYQEKEKAEQQAPVWKLRRFLKALKADDEQQTKRGLSLAVREFYYSLMLLQNYQV
ncbi:xenotropic and polytropic retrovirus receptor 1 homolog [Brienomyrus brachyistius]|uniref:xenotropic and polytropic retrovirus receptor 1 homolog n=1 Tax=Brienomyrus brachyistius TaxID=42636 RepID=UPI0020B181DA|nr:xenotropic and polytropic retrovirus receptor 1 homolog [Brienomyrus brachyistius]